ncbi:MAG: hypothetical protein ACI855_003438 [Myxococcota bacterium]|jgi:hypothetical protein
MRKATAPLGVGELHVLNSLGASCRPLWCTAAMLKATTMPVLAVLCACSPSTPPINSTVTAADATTTRPMVVSGILSSCSPATTPVAITVDTAVPMPEQWTFLGHASVQAIANSSDICLSATVGDDAATIILSGSATTTIAGRNMSECPPQRLRRER